MPVLLVMILPQIKVDLKECRVLRLGLRDDEVVDAVAIPHRTFRSLKRKEVEGEARVR